MRYPGLLSGILLVGCLAGNATAQPIPATSASLGDLTIEELMNITVTSVSRAEQRRILLRRSLLSLPKTSVGSG